MVPLPPLGNGEEIDPDNTNVAKPAGLTVRSEQFLQNVTNFKSRLRTMSQRQGELVRLIGILPQEGSVISISFSEVRDILLMVLYIGVAQ